MKTNSGGQYIHINHSVVEAKVLTWVKDSHGLFDYESTQLQQKKFKIDQSSCMIRDPSIARSGHYIIQYSHGNQEIINSKSIRLNSGNKDQFSINIKQTQNQLYANQIPVDPPNNNVYLIVRSLKNDNEEQKGYGLQLGDIIKLGRVKCIVSEIKNNFNSKSLKTKDFHLNVQKKYQVSDKLHGACKICLTDEEYENNFFVAPCSCKGSCEIVHLNCLKQWIASKIVFQQEQAAIAINFTKFQCEICKDPFPVTIIKNGIEHELFYIERPSCPYIMLQSFHNEGKGNKTLYLISQPKQGQYVRLGRGHQCQIRITDISVSREHARIAYDNGNFFVFDNNSKFGTLVKLQKSLPIKQQKIAVQVGRTVITCTLKQDEGKEKVSKIQGLNNQNLSSFFKSTV